VLDGFIVDSLAFRLRDLKKVVTSEDQLSDHIHETIEDFDIHPKRLFAHWLLGGASLGGSCDITPDPSRAVFLRQGRVFRRMRFRFHGGGAGRNFEFVCGLWRLSLDFFQSGDFS
jgi:hypothetical protein